MKTTALFVAAAASALAGAEAYEIAHIVNGTPVPAANYPWIVSLSTGGAAGRSFCGGSLIAPNVVLTAAHCVFTNAASITARIKGAATTKPQGAEPIQVAQAIRHPNYNSGTQDADVAILILATASTVTPVDMHITTDPLSQFDNAPVTAIGWGTTSAGGQAAADLLEVTVPVVSTAICNAAPAYPGAITNNMICAGLKAGGKDSCQGDSGGPLIATVNNKATLIAAVSWGQGCASPDKYGVYARVQTAMPFIRQYVPAAPVAGQATAAPVGSPDPPPAPLPAAEQVCRCSGCKGKYEICGAWDLPAGTTVCLLEDPSTDPAVPPNCKAPAAGAIRYSNNFKQYYMTGCIQAGLSMEAQGIVAQGLVGMSLENKDTPVGSGDEKKSGGVEDALPYVGAVLGTGLVVAGVVGVAMKKNRAAGARPHPSERARSNQMGYFDSKNNVPNARTVQL
jgi:hypothetical protein